MIVGPGLRDLTLRGNRAKNTNSRRVEQALFPSVKSHGSVGRDQGVPLTIAAGDDRGADGTRSCRHGVGTIRSRKRLFNTPIPQSKTGPNCSFQRPRRPASSGQIA